MWNRVNVDLWIRIVRRNKGWNLTNNEGGWNCSAHRNKGWNLISNEGGVNRVIPNTADFVGRSRLLRPKSEVFTKTDVIVQRLPKKSEIWR